MVAAGLCDEVLVQVSYAIGVAEPCGLFIDTYGTSKVEMSDGDMADKISEIFRHASLLYRTTIEIKKPYLF